MSLRLAKLNFKKLLKLWLIHVKKQSEIIIIKKKKKVKIVSNQAKVSLKAAAAAL